MVRNLDESKQVGAQQGSESMCSPSLLLKKVSHLHLTCNSKDRRYLCCFCVLLLLEVQQAFGKMQSICNFYVFFFSFLVFFWHFLSECQQTSAPHLPPGLSQSLQQTVSLSLLCLGWVQRRKLQRWAGVREYVSRWNHDQVK